MNSPIKFDTMLSSSSVHVLIIIDIYGFVSQVCYRNYLRICVYCTWCTLLSVRFDFQRCCRAQTHKSLMLLVGVNNLGLTGVWKWRCEAFDCFFLFVFWFHSLLIHCFIDYLFAALFLSRPHICFTSLVQLLSPSVQKLCATHIQYTFYVALWRLVFKTNISKYHKRNSHAIT